MFLDLGEELIHSYPVIYSEADHKQVGCSAFKGAPTQSCKSGRGFAVGPGSGFSL